MRRRRPLSLPPCRRRRSRTPPTLLRRAAPPRRGRGSGSRARAKLDGANPAYITVSEAVNERLQAWPASMPKLKQSITDLVLGPDGRCRQLGDVRGLTVEQQVDALVEQATDTNILSRTWVGWAPWLRGHKAPGGGGGGWGLATQREL